MLAAPTPIAINHCNSASDDESVATDVFGDDVEQVDVWFEPSTLVPKVTTVVDSDDSDSVSITDSDDDSVNSFAEEDFKPKEPLSPTESSEASIVDAKEEILHPSKPTSGRRTLKKQYQPKQYDDGFEVMPRTSTHERQQLQQKIQRSSRGLGGSSHHGSVASSRSCHEPTVILYKRKTKKPTDDRSPNPRKPSSLSSGCYTQDDKPQRYVPQSAPTLLRKKKLSKEDTNNLIGGLRGLYDGKDDPEEECENRRRQKEERRRNGTEEREGSRNGRRKPREEKQSTMESPKKRNGPDDAELHDSIMDPSHEHADDSNSSGSDSLKSTMEEHDDIDESVHMPAAHKSSSQHAPSTLVSSNQQRQSRHRRAQSSSLRGPRRSVHGRSTTPPRTRMSKSSAPRKPLTRQERVREKLEQRKKRDALHSVPAPLIDTRKTKRDANESKRTATRGRSRRATRTSIVDDEGDNTTDAPISVAAKRAAAQSNRSQSRRGPRSQARRTSTSRRSKRHSAHTATRRNDEDGTLRTERTGTSTISFAPYSPTREPKYQTQNRNQRADKVPCASTKPSQTIPPEIFPAAENEDGDHVRIADFTGLTESFATRKPPQATDSSNTLNMFFTQKLKEGSDIAEDKQTAASVASKNKEAGKRTKEKKSRKPPEWSPSFTAINSFFSKQLKQKDQKETTDSSVPEETEWSTPAKILEAVFQEKTNRLTSVQEQEHILNEAFPKNSSVRGARRSLKPIAASPNSNVQVAIKARRRRHITTADLHDSNHSIDRIKTEHSTRRRSDFDGLRNSNHSIDSMYPTISPSGRRKSLGAPTLTPTTRRKLTVDALIASRWVPGEAPLGNGSCHRTGRSQRGTSQSRRQRSKSREPQIQPLRYCTDRERKDDTQVKLSRFYEEPKPVKGKKKKKKGGAAMTTDSTGKKQSGKKKKKSGDDGQLNNFMASPTSKDVAKKKGVKNKSKESKAQKMEEDDTAIPVGDGDNPADMSRRSRRRSRVTSRSRPDCEAPHPSSAQNRSHSRSIVDGNNGNSSTEGARESKVEEVSQSLGSFLADVKDDTPKGANLTGRGGRSVASAPIVFGDINAKSGGKSRRKGRLSSVGRQRSTPSLDKPNPSISRRARSTSPGRVRRERNQDRSKSPRRTLRNDVGSDMKSAKRRQSLGTLLHVVDINAPEQPRTGGRSVHSMPAMMHSSNDSVPSTIRRGRRPRESALAVSRDDTFLNNGKGGQRKEPKRGVTKDGSFLDLKKRFNPDRLQNKLADFDDFFGEICEVDHEDEDDVTATKRSKNKKWAPRRKSLSPKPTPSRQHSGALERLFAPR